MATLSNSLCYCEDCEGFDWQGMHQAPFGMYLCLAPQEAEWQMKLAAYKYCDPHGNCKPEWARVLEKEYKALLLQDGWESEHFAVRTVHAHCDPNKHVLLMGPFKDANFSLALKKKLENDKIQYGIAVQVAGIA